MYLKRLEIQGFKSFADKTALDFLPSKNGRFSLTAIVGPNGAGKSNITDAIRWVMGETSLKNLRGKKSEDVIFNGSETKGAVGAAEVAMVLDNSEVVARPHPPLPSVEGRRRIRPSSLPRRQAGAEEGQGGGFGEVLLDFPEITITRRLYRTGESEYLVNNNPARLLDIHLLLARAQFAQHAYSIISQGMIDRLLTVTPSERKDWFDEACGIKEFQIKQHQAQLKLTRTEENMRAAETLILEVEPRLRILARQVKKLEKRQEVETELVAAQETYYATLYFKNKTEADSLHTRLSDMAARYRAEFEKLEAIQTELATLAHAATRQEVFSELQNKHAEAMRTKNNLERELAILEGQLHTEYAAAGAHNVSWLETKINELTIERDRLERELAQATAEAAKQAALIAAKQHELSQLTSEQTRLKLNISKIEHELIKGQSEESYRQWSGLTAVKAVLEAKQRLGKVYGAVAELGQVADEYQLALEVAAGAHLVSLVVENETVARTAIEYLRQNKFGVATFLPLNKISGGMLYDLPLQSESGVVGRALDLISFEPKFKPIFEMVFGNTLVVQNLAAAERIGIGRCRMVTLDGDLVERKGIMRGGYRTRGTSLRFASRILLADDDRRSELEAQLNLETHKSSEVETQFKRAQTELVEATIHSQTVNNGRMLLENESKKQAGELAKLEQERSLLTASPKEYSLQLKNLAKDKDKVVLGISTSNAVIKKIAREIAEFNEREEAKKQRVFKLQAEMQSVQTLVNAIIAERNELNIQLAKVETKQEDLGSEVAQEMKVTLHSLMERLGTAGVKAAAEEPFEEILNTIQKLKYQLSLIGGIDEEVIAEHATTKERYDFLSGQLKDLRLATDDLTEMIAELTELMKKKRAVVFKKIRHEFGRYFKILFDGGTADLEEVYGEVEEESEDSESSPNPSIAMEGKPTPLASAEEVGAVGHPSPQGRGTEGEGSSTTSRKQTILTGIEVIASPPGKKVRHLTMLSGGERTLTSIALICAILYHNPSPFVVLDEVEAALDEANTLRFTKIISELSTHSQFIVVTHNRVTMHAVDALYGVVMGPDGVSKLLSVKLEEAPQFANA